MTVKSDLEKARIAAQSALANYADFGNKTEDPMAKQMFKQMEQDMQRHIDMLNNRLNYLNQKNDLNQAQAAQQQQQQQQARAQIKSNILKD